MDREHDSED
jgi:serine/threonine-protein kinase SRPK3